MLKTRVLTAIFLLAVFLPALFGLPQTGWALLMALVAAIAAWEWGGLAGLRARGRWGFGALLLGVCVASHYASRTVEFDRFLVVLASLFWVLVLPFWLWRRWRAGRILLLCLGLVLIYATWRAFVDWRLVSPLMLLAIMGIAWVADIFAYFTGRAFGGKKLVPNISPGKTWAGVWGALAGVALYGALLRWGINPGWLPSTSTVSMDVLLMLALLALVALGVAGDLFESLLKRQAGLKDSSAILPGHGGVLDRIDSLMAILPCANALVHLALIIRP